MTLCLEHISNMCNVLFTYEGLTGYHVCVSVYVKTLHKNLKDKLDRVLKIRSKPQYDNFNFGIIPPVNRLKD